MITLDEKKHFIPVFSSVCSYCQYLYDNEGRKCKAFTNGIPDKIWYGTNKHTKSYPNDNGIRFTRIEKK
jgi:hypothetical protein